MSDYTNINTANEPSQQNCSGVAVADGFCPTDIQIPAGPDDDAVEIPKGTGSASKQKLCCKCRCLFPSASVAEYKETLKQLALLSWPVMLYLVTSLLLSMTSIIFSGHLGKDEIVASSLGQSVIHVFWRALMFGFANGADTLFSQTYGSKNKKRVGIIFQRMLLLITLLAIVCWGILLNTEGVLLLFGQDPQIAKLASGYSKIFIAATPADMVVSLLIKYLESQSIVWPVVGLVTIMGGLNILLHFIIVSALHGGLMGAVWAQVITYYLGAFMLLGYVCKKGIYKETWPGWSWECLQEWGTIMKLSVGGMGTGFVEWASFEAGFFITGLYGKTEVGAHAVLFNVSSVTWAISTGFGVGGTILIGNFLGAKNPVKAHMTASLCIVITALLGVLYIVFYLPVRNVLGYIFTKDIDVVLMVASILPIVAASEVFDSVNTAYYGILRGCGYLHVGAVVCIVGYAVGLSLGATLMFKYNYGLQGLWLGMLTSLILQFLLLMLFILFLIKWKKEAVKAQKRAAVLPNKKSLDKKQDGGIPLEPLKNPLEESVDILAQIDGQEFEESSSKSDESSIQRNKHHGDGNSSCQSVGDVEESGFHQQEPPEMQDSDCADVTEAGTTPKCSCSHEEKQHEARLEEEDDDSEIGVLTIGRLSLPQLILRRGSALFLCISFLLVSIYVSNDIIPSVRPAVPQSVNVTSNYTTEFTESFDLSTYVSS
ncbi:multidrug and toxin extrusion protein 1-like [Acanthaster planci]|uniref:Multidrug and toxin extrusion protein n=1 Tax=Acanthaster planci TaxID=133434 RepID=A0A8B8A7N3_ACAPL|nr:multidrug and toxin extrusion protein 1-like [Acanthaster planci]XP_022112047.1 multidrug and toxin extrusion protein 1-like [Acanthaster planci]